MASPTAQATLLGLPSDLLVRVLACLATEERARLPLVCKELDRLANDSATSLWESMELTVYTEHRRQALQATMRSLLQARGRSTKALCIEFSRGLPQPLWRVFGALLPPLFPALQQLTVGPVPPIEKRADYAFHGSKNLWRGLGQGLSMADTKFVMDRCSKLESLSLLLKGECLGEALVCIGELPGLTSLQLEVGTPPATAEELQAALRPLSGLRKMKRLVLYLPQTAHQIVLPASLPSQLPNLSHLTLTGCRVCLPASFSRMHHLTTLVLHASNSWTDFWGAVSGLNSLKQLSIDHVAAEVPPPLHPPAFSTSLTALSCTGALGGPQRQQTPTGAFLALPALKALHMKHMGMAERLDWGSLPALQAFECSLAERMEPRPVYMQPLLLTRLTSFHAQFCVTDETSPRLCQAKRLRSLTLTNTNITMLPESLTSLCGLTGLILEENYDLVFTAAVFHVLERMPVMQSLRACVCLVLEPTAPAVAPQSLAFLQAISGGLPACEFCYCHFEDWEPHTVSDDEGSDEDV